MFLWWRRAKREELLDFLFGEVLTEEERRTIENVPGSIIEETIRMAGRKKRAKYTLERGRGVISREVLKMRSGTNDYEKEHLIAKLLADLFFNGSRNFPFRNKLHPFSRNGR